MAVGIGINTVFGFAPESTYGTYVAAAKFLEIQSENIKRSQMRLSKPSLRRASADHRVLGKKSVGGGFEFQFSYSGAELLLKHVLGTNTTTGSGPYTHTMTGAIALPTGLSFYVGRDQAAISGSTAFRYEGCKISKLTLTQNAEEFLMAAAEVVGEDGSQAAAETPTYPTFSGATWDNFSCEVDDVAVGVESAEITFVNNLATGRHNLGTATQREPLRNNVRDITGSLTLEYSDATQSIFANTRSLTTNKLELIWTKSASESLTITLPTVQWEGEDPEVSDGGPIKFKLNFRAFLSTTEGDECSLVLVNGVSSIP